MEADRIDQTKCSRQDRFGASPIDNDGTLWPQQAWNELGVRREIHLDHRVNATLSGNLHDTVTNILPPVIDDVLRPGLVCNLGFLGRGHRSYDLRPLPPSKFE